MEKLVMVPFMEFRQNGEVVTGEIVFCPWCNQMKNSGVCRRAHRLGFGERCGRTMIETRGTERLYQYQLGDAYCL